VYRKLLRLNKEQVSAFTSGHVTNLIATDIGKFLDMLELPFLPKTLMVLVVCTYLIWDLIGAYALIAVGFPVLMIPVYVIFGSLYGRTRRDVSKMTDWRIKLSNEMLAGMRIIKMYAWERTFHRLIMHYRVKELDLLFKANRVRAVIPRCRSDIHHLPVKRAHLICRQCVCHACIPPHTEGRLWLLVSFVAQSPL
jgi:ABC-type bacteriocin/lantibiotic exporter with double-glycine peptidase domain